MRMETGQIDSRVIVAGGRDFNNYDLLKQKLELKVKIVIYESIRKNN